MKTKKEMTKMLTEEIGILDNSKIEAAKTEYNGVRWKITEANQEIADLEIELNSMKPLKERLSEAAAAGENLDNVESARDEVVARIATLRKRVGVLEVMLRQYESAIGLARDAVLVGAEAGVDRVRKALSPDLTALFQQAEAYHATWKDALREVLKSYGLTVQSFASRPEDSLAIHPTWDSNVLPLTVWLIPKLVNQTLGLVMPPTKEE